MLRPSVVLSSDYPVSIGNDVLYYPQSLGGGRLQIVGIALSGIRSVRANLPAVRSGGAVARWLNGLAAGPAGSLYYTEDRAVRRIDPQGRVSTVVQELALRDCVAIPGIEAVMRPYLRRLAVAASGCGGLLKITPRGGGDHDPRPRPLPGHPPLAVANGEAYVLEYLHTASDDRRQWPPRVRTPAADRWSP
ncbi:MAG: hypothetical protein JWN02_638 [Acidobacteria bacterium]|nr:hypothetical protein [Acidobacteriota bacterium]